MNESTAVTAYPVLASSTCTPTGGGSSACTYFYGTAWSTTTTKGTPTYTVGTSTLVNQDSLFQTTVLGIGLWIVIFALVVWVVRKLT